MMYRFIWEDDGEFVDDVVVSEFVAVRLLRAEGIEEADAGWLLKGRGAHLDTLDGYRLTVRAEG